MAPSSPRPHSARSRSGSATGSPPGWTSTRASATCTTTWTPPSVRNRARTQSRSAPAPPSGTSPSTAPSRTTPERTRHDQSHRSVRDRGRRTAQVIRRQGRARRHRPAGRRGDDLCAARRQRGRGSRRWPRPGPGTGCGALGHRRHRPVLGGGPAAHRRREPDPDGRPAPSGQGGGQAAGGRAAGPVRPGRRGQEAGRHLFRRHAPPARPGHGPDRRPPHHLPGRANGRAGPAQPPHHVADHPRAGGRRGDDLPDHPVPGGGRRARRPGRGPGPRTADRRGHPGGAQAPRSRRPRPPAVRRPGGTEVGGPRPGGVGPRRRGAHPGGPERRWRAVVARPARPARRGVGRGRQPLGAPARPRRRLPRPHRPTRQGKGNPAMSTLAYAVHDSRTMLRRNLRHMWRYPTLTLMVAGIPVVFLLLFVYVFGGTLGAGLGGPGGGRADYLAYVTPGILLMAVAGVAQGTAISVAMDMTEGIIARFRTMAIFRPSILTGHVVSAMTQTAASLAIVLAVALLIGFRPTASPVEWTATVGVLAMITFAITWLTVACGLVSKSVEAASNLPMPLLLLPFLGSGFVPTDSMPTALRWFAEYQPFTPCTETLRGLLLGTAIGNSAAASVAWCVGITLVSFLWARAAFNRDPGPTAT